MSKKKLTKVPPKGRMVIWQTLADQGGCGYIRGIWPSILLGQLRYKGMRFQSTYGYQFILNETFYKPLTFMKMQRPAGENHLKLIQAFQSSIKKKTNTPLLIEVDDLLSPDIPETNYARPFYEENWPYIQECFRLCDGITVSTEKLKEVYSPYNDNIVVIPNSLPRFLWGESSFSGKETNKPRILYAGSSNHFNQEGSGGDFAPELIEYIQKTLDKYQWVFIGGVPYELRKNSKIELHDWQSIFDLPTFIRNLNIDIGLAPLEHNLFNQCKSNLKLLEYSCLGIPGVYTNIDPYQGTELASNTPEEMISNIEYLASDVSYRKNVYESDLQKVKDVLYLEDNLINWVNLHLKLFGKKLG